MIQQYSTVTVSTRFFSVEVVFLQLYTNTLYREDNSSLKRLTEKTTPIKTSYREDNSSLNRLTEKTTPH